MGDSDPQSSAQDLASEFHEANAGVVAFVDAGQVDHNDFLTSAWGGAPLRDILARIGG